MSVYITDALWNHVNWMNSYLNPLTWLSQLVHWNKTHHRRQAILTQPLTKWIYNHYTKMIIRKLSRQILQCIKEVEWGCTTWRQVYDEISPHIHAQCNRPRPIPSFSMLHAEKQEALQCCMLFRKSGDEANKTIPNSQQSPKEHNMPVLFDESSEPSDNTPEGEGDD